ncbi:MAG: outer membrane lipoprotein chaperone LolA [Steroidobacteraceae bacterium]
MRKPSRFLAVCMLSLCALTATAQTEVTVDSGYETLDRFFKGLQTLQADFTQTVQDSRGQVADKSSGKLAIKKPGKFRWDYAKPNEQTIVSDSTRIWLYDPELEQVTIRRADLSLNGTPAILLSGEGNLRDSFEVEHVEQRDGMTVINLSPKRSDTDFKLVQIALRKDQLVAMSLTDKLGQTTLLQFTQFKRNATLSDSQFKFSPPKGVDVIDNTGGAKGK